MHKLLLAAFLALPLLSQGPAATTATPAPTASPLAEATKAKPSLSGDLMITTKRVVIDKTHKTGELILINGGPAPHTYRITLAYREMSSKGMVGVRLDARDGDPSLDWIRWSPKQVTIAPGETQSIRISARTPADYAKGELLYSLTIKALPDLPSLSEEERELKARELNPDAEPALRPVLQVAYSYSIPLIVRVGSPDPGKGLLSGLVFSSGNRNLTYRLARVSGETSLYGTISATVTPPAGSVDPKDPKNKVQTAVAKGIGLYLKVPERSSDLGFEAPVPSKSKVRLEWTPEGATQAESVVEVEAP